MGITNPILQILRHELHRVQAQLGDFSLADYPVTSSSQLQAEISPFFSTLYALIMCLPMTLSVKTDTHAVPRSLMNRSLAKNSQGSHYALGWVLLALVSRPEQPGCRARHRRRGFGLCPAAWPWRPEPSQRPGPSEGQAAQPSARHTNAAHSLLSVTAHSLKTPSNCKPASEPAGNRR